MAGRKYEWQFTIYGQGVSFNIEPPLEWNDLNIQVSFEELGNTNIEIEEITLVNEAYSFTKDIIDNGNVLGSYALSIELKNNINNETLYEEFFTFDMSTVTFFDDKAEPKVKIKLRDIKQGSSLQDFLNANSFQNIYPNGVGNGVENQAFSDMFTRVGVLVEKEDTTLEEIILFVTLYQLSVQLADAVQALAKTLTDGLSHAAGGISGSAALFLYTLGVATLQTTYVVSIIIAMKELVTRLQELLFPIPFTRWCLNLGQALTGIINQAGYEIEFSSDISKQIFSEYYLPSNIEDLKDSQISYLPKPSDYGYLYSEFVDMILKKYEARLINYNGKILVSNENEDILYINSEYNLPNILEKPYTLNIDDFYSREIYSYETDISDEYTIKNYKGTSYEIVNNVEDNVDNNKLKDVSYGVALGNRKDEISILESLFKSVVDTVNAILKVLFTQPINNPILADRIGLLKISNKSWSLPKLLRLETSNASYLGKKVYKLPSNHRDLISAKSNYDNHHIKMIFSNDKNRRREYEQVRIFFDYNSYKKLVNNNYFNIEGSSKKGRVTSLSWNIDNDYAIIDYYIIDGYNIGSLTNIFTEVG